MTMKVAAISDLHGLLPKDLPQGDVLCICGDIVPLEYQRDLVQSIAWFCLEFVPWTDSLPYKKVIFVAGNHDFFLEALHRGASKTWDEQQQMFIDVPKWRSPREVLTKLLPGCNKGKHKLVYLCDNSVEIDGKTFYGSPWIANLHNWAFYKTEDELREMWSRVPHKCDVLMTHMPPSLCEVGQVHQRGSFNHGTDYGSESLATNLIARNIRWSISGHVHSGAHQPTEYKDGQFVANVSLKNEDYNPTYYPLEFEI